MLQDGRATSFRWESDPTPRIPLLGVFLVLTMVPAGWLGYEAVAAAGSQRGTTEAVLTDCARVALSSFARTPRGQLYDLLDEALGGTPIHTLRSRRRGRSCAHIQR